MYYLLDLDLDIVYLLPSFFQMVFAQKPNFCCRPPPRREAKVEVKVEQRAKRSPEQSLSLLAFTYISNDMCLIPIKR